MSEFGDLVQSKCDAFADRVVRLNDFLLKQAANAEPEVRWLKVDGRNKKIIVKPIPVFLQAVANICNQLLRAGTSVGANNSEATSAISKADYKSKSYIALKEARESLYWIDLLHRNKYLDEVQYASLHSDCEELVRIFVSRCKKLDSEG